MVIIAEPKADLAFVVERKLAIYRLALAVGFLPGDRFLQFQFARFSLQNQVASVVDLDGFRSGESQANAVGIGSGGDQKIVFQLALVAVPDQVNARINFVVFDASEIGDVRPPTTRIISDEVIRFARQFIQCDDV